MVGGEVLRVRRRMDPSYLIFKVNPIVVVDDIVVAVVVVVVVVVVFVVVVILKKRINEPFK